MKHSLVCVALIALMLSACGKKEEAPKPKASSPPPPAREAQTYTPPPVPSSIVDSGADKQVALRTYWNVWWEDDAKAQEVLKPRSMYQVVLDLSRYSYSDDLVAAAGDLESELRRAAKLERRELSLTVQVLLLSDSLAFVDDSKHSELLPVSMHAVKEDRDTEFEADRKKLLDMSSPSLMPELAKKFSAGSISVRVRTRDGGGCAQIAFSIWDAGFSRPLDHVVFTVPIQANDNSPPPTCRVPRVQGSFAALSGALSAEGPPQVDAALHIFEFSSGGSPRTAAIYVDAHVFMRAMPDKETRDRGIYTWLLQSSLREYIASDLVHAVEKGRSAAGYIQAAEELRTKIFLPDSTSGKEQAQLAFDSFVRIANSKPTPAVVLVRAVMSDGHQMYVPLALLATSGAKLAKRPVIVYPLPRENYAKDSCISDWTLGIPESIPDGETVDLSKTELSERMRSPLRSIPALRSYLDPTGTSADKSMVPEAMLLLAHQAGGRLWFQGDGRSDRLFSHDIRKEFPRGSIAILTACGTASPDGGNQRVLERLNQKGVDAMLVSPFPVDANYGKALALAVMHVVKQAHQDKKPLTLLQVFEQAAEYLVTQEVPESLEPAMRDRRRNEMREMTLEFIIVGNHEARLCVR